MAISLLGLYGADCLEAAARAVAIDVAAMFPDIPAQLLAFLGGKAARPSLALLPATLRLLVPTEFALALQVAQPFPIPTEFALALQVALLQTFEARRMIAA